MLPLEGLDPDDLQNRSSWVSERSYPGPTPFVFPQIPQPLPSRFIDLFGYLLFVYVYIKTLLRVLVICKIYILYMFIDLFGYLLFVIYI